MRSLLDTLIFGSIIGNVISRLVGSLMRSYVPRWLRPSVYRGFAKAVDIQLNEVEKDLREYASLNAFFTRYLKPGLRPLADAPVVIPCDGALTISDTFDANALFQAKGVAYRLSELIPGCTLDTGSFSTIYLSPKDCHLVFSPADAQLTAIHLIPGHLFPVREPYISTHDTLYTRNERLVFQLDQETGDTLYVVMVGAMNVGSMTTPLAPHLLSNSWGGKAESMTLSEPKSLNKGDLLGVFHLGSTVVLVSSDKEALSNWSPGPCQRGEL